MLIIPGLELIRLAPYLFYTMTEVQITESGTHVLFYLALVIVILKQCLLNEKSWFFAKVL